jgi:hypothetical protein
LTVRIAARVNRQSSRPFNEENFSINFFVNDSFAKLNKKSLEDEMKNQKSDRLKRVKQI